MTRPALIERHALCDTLERVGPSAPTLCDPWTTRELGAHLALRERRPDALPGIVLQPLAGHTEKVLQSYAQRPWPELVSMVRSGPPRWWPTRAPALDQAVNTSELYVHHEDVLRATGPGAPRRETSPALQEALWVALARAGRALFRRSPVGVVLVADGHGRRAVKGPGQRGTVVLHGLPGELVLYGFGRARVAEVVADGSPQDVGALASARLGV